MVWRVPSSQCHCSAKMYWSYWNVRGVFAVSRRKLFVEISICVVIGMRYSWSCPSKWYSISSLVPMDALSFTGFRSCLGIPRVGGWILDLPIIIDWCTILGPIHLQRFESLIRGNNVQALSTFNHTHCPNNAKRHHCKDTRHMVRRKCVVFMLQNAPPPKIYIQRGILTE